MSPATASSSVSAIRQRSPARRAWKFFLLPAVIWALIFIILPYLGIFVFSFWKTDYVDLIPAFSLDNFERLFTDPVVRVVVQRTLVISLVVTVLTLVISFPLSYLGAFYVHKHKQLYAALIIAPMWVAYILRAYSWRLVLGSDGVINSILIGLGLIEKPLGIFLFSPYAVVLTLTHIYLPFMFVSLFSVMDSIAEDMLRAAADLYANPLRRFVEVTLPLSFPGIAAGILFVFPLTFGDYIAATLVGGTNGQMLATLVQNQFGVTFNWPFGAAMATAILFTVLVVVRILERWQDIEDVRVY